MGDRWAEGRKVVSQRVGLWTHLSSVLTCALVWLALLAAPVAAHEVQPSVLTLELTGDTALIDVEATLEPFIAGIDLEGLFDTNEADRSEANDALRREDPEALAQSFRDHWPQMGESLKVMVAGAALPLALETVEVPEVGDPELPRVSTFRASVALPEGDAPVTVVWAPRLGAAAIRQAGVGDEGYSVYLPSGGETDPIPRAGVVAQSPWAAFFDYIPVGYEHIVPLGLDHILFVLGLFFLSTQMRPLLWQVTAFTLAHTLTLALAALGVVSIPASIVEPLIAASIVYVGVENVLSSQMSRWRPMVVLAFGLLHGLGFAGVLAEYGLGTANFVPKLIGFNVGVELGQLSVIAAAFLLVGVWFRNKPWYKSRIANPASILIALVGAYWFLERTIL
ncbi:HupE/UreJ family protein [Palleronia caenipelagi]|uniref:HupE/UreJ family protein n=1 Tax=Palleronia caenipelagi TaxID=2489174 RepID=A0A547Q9K2_9RHOB|nr:HupE/UreJ family protein [Palleronia caenipelagi]TRD23067.1 HupE/UreJ family protein [Palleronia caenipelagi]